MCGSLNFRKSRTLKRYFINSEKKSEFERSRSNKRKDDMDLISLK